MKSFFVWNNEKGMLLAILFLFLPSPSLFLPWLFGLLPTAYTIFLFFGSLGQSWISTLIVFLNIIVLLGFHYLIACFLYKYVKKEIRWILLSLLIIASFFNIYLFSSWGGSDWINIVQIITGNI